MELKPHNVPFHFNLRVVQRDVLPFELGGNRQPENPTDTPNPPKPQPKPPIVSTDWSAVWSAVADVGACETTNWQSADLHHDLLMTWVDVAPISGCLKMGGGDVFDLWRVFTGVSGRVAGLHHCWQKEIVFAPRVELCASSVYRASVHYAACATARQSYAPHLTACAANQQPMAVLLANCFTDQSDSLHLSGCLKTSMGRSVQPPCEYYPIPIEPTLPPRNNRCKTPDSNRIPFHFSKRRTEYHAARIPLPFSCTTAEMQIPSLDGYMILNEISANLADGTPLILLSLNIRSDMSGYCWQADLTVAPDSFAKIHFRQPEQSVISVFLNGERFDFLAEDFSDNRQFGTRSYTITGRSITAHLGAAYAPQGAGLVDADLYARQIADSQLKFTGFTISDWAIVDWLVPKNVYSLTDKTPIAVLQDIAQTAGGFVCSHPHLPRLDVRPRWKMAAWELGGAAPDVQVPSSAIISISGQLQQNQRANAVGVIASHHAGKAANVHRRGLAQTPRLGDLSHALYTEYSVCAAAGVAALSDSGVHKTETVKLPLMPKYGLNRAELGTIWRFDEPSISWRGVITSVQISVEMRDDVPVIYQTLGVNRYMDD